MNPKPIKLQNLKVLTSGQRVIIIGSHPWVDDVGRFLKYDNTPFGVKALIELDNGTDCYADSNQFNII